MLDRLSTQPPDLQHAIQSLLHAFDYRLVLSAHQLTIVPALAFVALRLTLRWFKNRSRDSCRKLGRDSGGKLLVKVVH